MPSKASTLVQIARAARSVAAATRRLARLAEQAALSQSQAAAAAASHAPDRAGARHPLMHRHVYAVGAPAPAMDAPNPQTHSGVGPGFPSFKDLSNPNGRVVEFVAEEKDLESDEALWALYERWCKAFNQKREHGEMVRRFDKFKSTALRVHRTNNANLPYKLGINKFADGKLRELCANRDPHYAMLAKKVGNNSSVLWKRDGGFLREVFADFEVVNGKLFVHFPAGEADGGGLKEIISTEYQVVGGRLFADLPQGHELVLLNMEFLTRRGF